MSKTAKARNATSGSPFDIDEMDVEPTVAFVGAGVGGAIRHGMNMGIGRLMGTHFPWHTFVINISGSLVIGEKGSIYSDSDYHGTYTLLPARYAALDGAFLVQAASGGAALAAGTSLKNVDGTSLIGARLVAGCSRLFCCLIVGGCLCHVQHSCK